MNSYRVALILCRAVALALWWSAGLRILAPLISVVASRLNSSGLFAFSTITMASAVPMVVAAIFLQIFAVSLAASMTGNSAFEGEAITKRGALEPSERALAGAGAGLFLLFFGVTIVVPSILSVVSLLLSPGSATSTTLLSGFVNSILHATLQCLVGFVLAFMLGLRRMMKSTE